MGLLLTDLRADFATTRLRTLAAAALPDMADAFRTLRAQAEAGSTRKELHRRPAASRAPWTCAMRGRTTNSRCRCPRARSVRRVLDTLSDGFAAAHQRLYGFVAEDEPMQLVTFRVEAAGVVPKASVPAAARCRARCVGRGGGAARSLAAGGRRVHILSGVRTRQTAARELHRGSCDHRADGRDDAGAARHGCARGSVSEPGSDPPSWPGLTVGKERT